MGERIINMLEVFGFIVALLATIVWILVFVLPVVRELRYARLHNKHRKEVWPKERDKYLPWLRS